MSLFFGQVSSDDTVQSTDESSVAELALFRSASDAPTPTPASPDKTMIHPFPSVDDIVDRLTNDTETAGRRLRAR